MSISCDRQKNAATKNIPASLHAATPSTTTTLTILLERRALKKERKKVSFLAVSLPHTHTPHTQDRGDNTSYTHNIERTRRTNMNKAYRWLLFLFLREILEFVMDPRLLFGLPQLLSAIVLSLRRTSVIMLPETTTSGDTTRIRRVQAFLSLKRKMIVNFNSPKTQKTQKIHLFILLIPKVSFLL